MRQLHAWRLLSPAYNAVGVLGIQVSICVQQVSIMAPFTALAAQFVVGWQRILNSGHPFSKHQCTAWLSSFDPADCLSRQQVHQPNTSDRCLRALQADKLAHSQGSRVRRSVGIAADYLVNRLSAAAESAFTHDATFQGETYLPGSKSGIPMGECAATAAPHLALASSQK